MYVKNSQKLFFIFAISALRAADMKIYNFR